MIILTILGILFIGVSILLLNENINPSRAGRRFMGKVIDYKIYYKEKKGIRFKRIKEIVLFKDEEGNELKKESKFSTAFPTQKGLSVEVYYRKDKDKDKVLIKTFNYILFYPIVFFLIGLFLVILGC